MPEYMLGIGAERRDAARAEAEALALDAKSLKEQLGALGAAASGAFSITLRAPIAGTVIARDAVVGQPVSPEQTLGSVAALDEVWFLGRVFEKDLGRLNVGASAEIRLNAYPGEHFAGSVEYIGQQVDPTARVVTARVRLQNRDGLLRIGLFGTAAVALGGAAKEPARLVVERAAVSEIAGKSVVFVRENDVYWNDQPRMGTWLKPLLRLSRKTLPSGERRSLVSLDVEEPIPTPEPGWLERHSAIVSCWLAADAAPAPPMDSPRESAAMTDDARARAIQRTEAILAAYRLYCEEARLGYAVALFEELFVPKSWTV